MADKQLAKAFKAAKDHLARHNTKHKSRLICCALADARDNKRISTMAYKKAIAVIHQRLNGSATLYTWLHSRGYAFEMHRDMNCNAGRKLQATRHAWLDSLIEEFS